MILAKRPEIDRFLKAPDPAIRAAVIHGKDRSGVAERAEVLCRTVTPDLNDPFNVTVLTDGRDDADQLPFAHRHHGTHADSDGVPERLRDAVGVVGGERERERDADARVGHRRVTPSPGAVGSAS